MKKKARVAVVTGSFDPVTVGHLDLFRRAAAMFEKVWVDVSENGAKTGTLSAETRCALVRASLDEAGLSDVQVGVCAGLVSDFMHEKKAAYIVRGVRDSGDFDYENDLARIMQRFDPAFETVFLPAKPELSCISSTYVRELMRYGCPLEGAVPPAAIALLREEKKD